MILYAFRNRLWIVAAIIVADLLIAAWDALEPTVKLLQPSALLLLDRMIEA